MTHLQDPEQLIRSANPVPRPEDLPGMDTAAVLAAVVERASVAEESVPRRRRSRMVIAAAAMAALLATGAAAAVLTSGGNLPEPAFAGEGWELIVGEETNKDGTYKVCHTFVPNGGADLMDGALGVSGCINWPDGSTDALPATGLDAIETTSAVVVLVELGPLEVASVVAEVEGGAPVTVEPFTMPQSGRQFAVIEIPRDAEVTRLQAVSEAGVVLDSRDAPVIEIAP